jgi:glycerol-3-phosphate dehydrogenase (NAD(P)+)
MNITVFGSGGWGTAVAKVLCENGHRVTLWSKFEKEVLTLKALGENPLLPGVKIPADILITSDISEALKDIQMAVMATPSFAVADTALLIKDKMPADAVIVCISKGIEKDTTRLFSRILRDTLGDGVRLASLSGPTHAEEVGRQIPTACVAASEDIKTAEAVQDVFMNDYLRVYTTTDVIGVELGAALKNVIALGAGISDGLGFGDNTIAMLMTRGLAEMAELCVKLGGRKQTLAGLAGLGDLIVTCTSKHSRNRRAGVLIGKGMDVQEAMREVGAVVEGYYAAKAAYELSLSTGVDMPICTEAYKVLYEGKSPMEAMRDLMSRARRHESDTGEETWVG